LGVVVGGDLEGGAGEVFDQAGDGAGGLGDEVEGGGCDDVVMGLGEFEVVVDVLGDLVFGKWFEVDAQGDALAEGLADFHGEQADEFVSPDEDDWDQG